MTHGRVRRVRWWIRALAVAIWLGLFAEQSSIIHFVRAGQMDPSQIPQGWVALTMLAICIWLLTFRPFIAVDDDAVVLQGPLRRTRMLRDEVAEVGPTVWGLRFTCHDGFRRTSIVCQDTSSFAEPRWFDVAEAVTGVRPACRNDEADDGPDEAAS